jgi:glycosyltransferase involved in cell wall biosynthesis
MNLPKISILLPVFNGELFLKDCIDSLLLQTFTDFELLIVNDGSTDDTEKIICSYTDPRIRYIKNEKNSGLIYSLNLGIIMARGVYIARMDADDIALPGRLMDQNNFLDTHPGCGVVAGCISFIDHNNRHIGDWPLDRKTITFKSIYKTMPFENCLAHPSIMGRTHIFKKLLYNPRQKHLEDYHLWLIMLSKGIIIEKISSPILLYRDNPGSITNQTLRKDNFFFRHARMKKDIIVNAFKDKELTGYHLLILLAMLLDITNGCAKAIKSIFN